MPTRIRMSKQKMRILNFKWPILYGSVSTAMAKCGQKNCRCQTDPTALHGPYYRWIGNINGKKTTRTISKETAEECRQWIKNYEKLQQQIDKLMTEAIDSAPWESRVQKKWNDFRCLEIWSRTIQVRNVGLSAARSPLTRNSIENSWRFKFTSLEEKMCT